METWLFLAIAVSGTCLLTLLLVWFCVDAASLFAASRARDAPRKLGVYLRITPCYDGLLTRFKCQEVTKDGKLTGAIQAEEPLLTKAGLLEESSVALLLDSLTGFVLWSTGYPGFVSAELSFKVHAKVKQGEELFIKAWISQKPKAPKDKRLRESAMLAFEMYRTSADQTDSSAEALVAEGEQLMLSIAKPSQRAYWKLQLFCPIFWDLKWQMDMKVLESFNKYSKPFAEVRSINELLGLKTKEEDPASYVCMVTPRLMNVNGVGHGAAIAALLCAAAKMSRPGASVKKASVVYVLPVPGMQPIALGVKPVASSNDELQIFLQSGQGQVLARGKVTLLMPPPPPAPLPKRSFSLFPGGLLPPITSPLEGVASLTAARLAAHADGVEESDSASEGEDELSEAHALSEMSNDGMSQELEEDDEEHDEEHDQENDHETDCHDLEPAWVYHAAAVDSQVEEEGEEEPGVIAGEKGL
mmetsp:Transcript_43262/g.100957  ORF Transcript_43262/g.100957 Transcript_43262/m.100957 type:complete len:472 (-) Transcript_43262:85-1500(-)